MLAKVFLLTIILYATLGQETSLAQETFVLIHGSGLGAWSWYKVKARLEQKGHTVIALDLPGSGVDKTDIMSVQLQDHINAVVNVVDSQPQPVILVGHSYGGLLVSSVSELRPNKVKKAVFVAGVMLQNGESIFTAGQNYASSDMSDSIIVTDADGNPTQIGIKPEAIKRVLCGDCSNEDVTLIKSLNILHPAITFLTPITVGDGFASVPKVYVSTLEDADVVPQFQQEMYSHFPDTTVYTVKSSHMVLLSQPGKLVDIIMRNIMKDNIKTD